MNFLLFPPKQLLNVRKNTSTASLPAVGIDFMLKPAIGIDSKISCRGLNYYSASTIHQMVHDLEEHYKKYYVKPECLPYKKNMARQFSKSAEESSEQRTRKSIQAETSRISRDKNKFMRTRLEEDNEILQTMLCDHVVRLVNLECYANELLMKNGQQPVDWRSVWEDDVRVEEKESAEGDNGDKGEKSAMGNAKHASHGSNTKKVVDVDVVGDDQCMVASDEADSDNENLTIYEYYGEGTISGEDE